MNNLFFWNAWPDTPRHLFQALLALLGVALVYYLTGYFWSSGLVIQWETVSKISPLPLLVESWTFASIPLNIMTDQYVITQIFEGSDLIISSWPAVMLLLIMGICLAVGLSLATDLNRFWFLASQVLFIFMMVGFKPEQLLLFDRTDKSALILAFILYLPASYYFHAVKKNAPLSIRLLVFGILTLVFALVINYYGGVSHPFLYLVDYGIPVPMGLTVVFILLTSHEIIYSFLFLITRANTPSSSNSFFHFFALSLIYLVNVLLLYLKNTRRIEWDFYYIDAFWLLIAAGLIGIWSLRQRGELFKNIIPVEPHALLGYLALAAISFATIGFFFATANDPAIEALEDMVVFGHLCIGFVFLIYVLFNFRDVLIANLKVYKVVYKPRKMPFFSMRLGGFIGVLGLFLLSDQYPLDQAVTAYYNGIGDLHRLDDKPMLAKEYYKLAAIYASTNHRSNYAIASMAKEQNNYSDALAYYKQSTIKQPTPFAFVNTARAHEEQGMFFKAMFTLKDGLVEFPENPYISNNLAALYAKTDLIDSAYYLLLNRSGNPQVQKVRQTNRLALLARVELGLSLDSILTQTDREYPEVISNLISIANIQRQELSGDVELPSDTLINPITFAWWYNYSLNHRYKWDSVQMSFMEEVMNVAGNELYRDNLDFSRALRMYYSGNVHQAFLTLNNLQFRNSGKSGFYNDLLGQWSLQQGQPKLALDYFEESIRAGHLPALWHQALALLAVGQVDRALKSWNIFLSSSKDHSNIAMSELMTFIKEEGPTWESLNEQQKAWHLQFKAPHLSWAVKRKMLEEIKNPIINQQIEQWWWNLSIDSSSASLVKLEEAIDNQRSSLRQLQSAVLHRKFQEIEQLIVDLDEPDFSEHDWVVYANALLSEKNQQPMQAEKHFQALTRNPFFVPGIIGASRYYRTVVDDQYRAYEILLDALSVNRYSISLLKAYGEQCTRLNLDSYRQTALESLQDLLTTSEYDKYISELQVLEDSLVDGFDNLDLEEDF